MKYRKEPTVQEVAETPAEESALEVSIGKLTKDLRKAAETLTPNEARFLVDAYYAMQDNRIRADGQIRSMTKSKEPHVVLSWLSTNAQVLEGQIKRTLDVWSQQHAVGRWSRSIIGIGPVIAAGLLAHIDIEPWICTAEGEKIESCHAPSDDPAHARCGKVKIETVGHVWSFAGLNPEAVWEKGEKRPWNAGLKVLCWKIGESFVKFSGHKDDIYGKYYLKRKDQEMARNAVKKFSDQAKLKLEKFRIGKSTEAYKAYSQGLLPPGHIHARAKRYAVKLFLAHWFEVAYRAKWNTQPPLPYPIAHMGHVHKIDPPNLPTAA